MKKFLLLILYLFLFLGCTKAYWVSQEKNNAAADNGLKRRISVYSAYTATLIYQKVITHSYYDGGTSNGTDIDVLDLDNKLKTSVLANNAIVIIKEIE